MKFIVDCHDKMVWEILEEIAGNLSLGAENGYIGTDTKIIVEVLEAKPSQSSNKGDKE